MGKQAMMGKLKKIISSSLRIIVTCPGAGSQDEHAGEQVHVPEPRVGDPLHHWHHTGEELRPPHSTGAATSTIYMSNQFVM